MWTEDSTWRRRGVPAAVRPVFCYLAPQEEVVPPVPEEGDRHLEWPRQAWSSHDALTGWCAGCIGVAGRHRRRDAFVPDGAAAGFEPAGGALAWPGGA